MSGDDMRDQPRSGGDLVRSRAEAGGRRRRQPGRVIGLVAAVVALSGAAALTRAAAVPKSWSAGDNLTAKDLNDSFSALQARIDELQSRLAVIPAGTVVAFAGPVAPPGWLVCDGMEVDRGKFPDLFAAIGTVHGSGNGATTFRLPDYRGMFLRGAD